MPDEIRLPAIAALLLLWGLVCALWQRRPGSSTGPWVIWRDATAGGWSDWHAHQDISAEASHADILAAAHALARVDATAVQFAIVAHPPDAPDYTLRVLFMSFETAVAPDRDFAAIP